MGCGMILAGALHETTHFRRAHEPENAVSNRITRAIEVVSWSSTLPFDKWTGDGISLEPTLRRGSEGGGLAPYAVEKSTTQWGSACHVSFSRHISAQGRTAMSPPNCCERQQHGRGRDGTVPTPKNPLAIAQECSCASGRPGVVGRCASCFALAEPSIARTAISCTCE